MRYFFVISALLLLSQKSLKCQQFFTGFIVNMADSSAIEATHILNISSNELAISTKNGGFTIKATKLDTLLFSNVNYKSRQFIVLNFAAVTVSLKPLNIQLEEVIVYSMPKSAADFRKELIKMDHQITKTFLPQGVKPGKPKAPIPPLFQEEKLLNFGPNANPNSSMFSLLSIPIYYFPKKFNRDYKSEMKYYKLKAEKKSTITSEKKYNREIVQQLTNYKEDRLTEFIQYLDIDPSFVLRTSAYEIAVYIKKKHVEFNDLLKKDSVNVIQDHNR